MIGLRKFLWLGPALLAAPLPAAAQDMCAALDRLAASSREPVPFASLQERNARGVELIPGFGDVACRIRPGDSVACWRTFAPDSLEVDRIEPVMRDCLGVPAASRSAPRGSYRDRDIVFIAAGLRYRISNQCDPHCRAGRLVSFEVRFADRARRPSPGRPQ